MQQANTNRWQRLARGAMAWIGKIATFPHLVWAGVKRLWRWLDEKPTQGAIFMSIVLVPLFAVIPDYYTLEARIPPPEQLKRSEGVLEFTRGNKTGVRTFLHTQEGRRAFTCAVPNWRNETCFKDQMAYGDKHAVVWWFDMRSYLFLTRPYVVRMDVEGKTVLSYRESINRLQSMQEDGWLTTWIFITLFGLLTLATYLFQRWKRSKGL